MPWIDRLFQPDVGITRAFGAQIAQRREPGKQRRPRLCDRARGAKRQRFVQYLIVPLGLVIGMEEQVAVPLDHAGEQGLARQRHRLGIWRGHVRPGGFDLAGANQDLPAGVQHGAVEHRIGR